EPGREPALGDRAIEVMRLIFLAAPYELHRSSRELLGDSDHLAHEILRAAAPAEAAALVVVVGLALVQRQPGRGRERRHGRLGVLARHPDLGLVFPDSSRATHGLNARIR